MINIAREIRDDVRQMLRTPLSNDLLNAGEEKTSNIVLDMYEFIIDEVYYTIVNLPEIRVEWK